MEQQTYNTKLVEGLCDRVLGLEPSATDRAHAYACAGEAPCLSAIAASACVAFAPK